MIDSNIVDKLSADSVSLNNLKTLSASGEISVRHTHVQLDELTVTPESRSPSAAVLLQVLAQSGSLQQSSDVFVLDVSRLDEARLGDPTSEAVYDAVSKGGTKSAKDGVIAATEARLGHVLVTEDRRLRKRAGAVGVECWTFGDLQRFLDAERHHECHGTDSPCSFLAQ